MNQPDYEMNHYRTGSEIRAIYCDRPSEIVGEFPNPAAAYVAWNQVMAAIGLLTESPDITVVYDAHS